MFKGKKKVKYTASEFNKLKKEGKIRIGVDGKLITTKEKKKKEKPSFNGIEFDSSGELYISWWLDELKKNGYIKKWTSQPEPFILTTKITRSIIKKLKTKSKTIEEFVDHGMIYTADFKIEWTDEAILDNIIIDFNSNTKKEKHHLFHFNKITYLEAKPDNYNLKIYDDNNMIRVVRGKIKQVYDKHKIYINLVFHNKLFFTTFTPERYLFQDKGNGLRKLKYKTRSLSDFIKLIQLKESQGHLNL